jgi:hypothetical protein
MQKKKMERASVQCSGVGGDFRVVGRCYLIFLLLMYINILEYILIYSNFLQGMHEVFVIFFFFFVVLGVARALTC